MEKLSYNDKLRMKMFREQGLRAKSIIFSYRDKGWKLSTVRKVCSRVDHTGSAQPFCVNQAVGDLPQCLHAQFVVVRQFSHW